MDHRVRALVLVKGVEEASSAAKTSREMEELLLACEMAKVNALLAIEERLQRIEKIIPGSILI